MTFSSYLKEQEVIAIQQEESNKMEQVADFFRTMEDLNDDKFRNFAVNDLGLSEEESETIVYKMLRDFLLKDEAPKSEFGDDAEILSIDIDDANPLSDLESAIDDAPIEIGMSGDEDDYTDLDDDIDELEGLDDLDDMDIEFDDDDDELDL